MIFIMKIINLNTGFFHTKWQVKHTKLENANFVLNKYRNDYFVILSVFQQNSAFINTNKEFLRMTLIKQKVSTFFVRKIVFTTTK